MSAFPSLRASFNNSFFSADYRRGAETLLEKVGDGMQENEDILRLIENRASSLSSFAKEMSSRPRGRFGENNLSSLANSFRALEQEALDSIEANKKLARSLSDRIINPFGHWSEGHASRFHSVKTEIHANLLNYELLLSRVQNSKRNYDTARRAADEIEEELEFDGKPVVPQAITTAEEEIDSDDDNVSLIKTFSALKGLSRGVSTRIKQSITSPARPRTPRSNSPIEEGIESKELPSSPSPSRSDGPSINGALEWSKGRLATMMGTGPVLEKRQEADNAEKLLKEAIFELDGSRQALECCLKNAFSYLEKLELDRVKAVDSVMKSFTTSLLSASTTAVESIETCKAMTFVNPETDVAQIIESLKTGPYVPQLVAFHSVYSESEPVFGADLSKYDETKSDDTTESIPPVLSLLLDHLRSRAVKIPAVKLQTAWILEAPLSAVNQLRNALNYSSSLNEVDLERYDLPLITNTVKQYLLELNPPLIPFTFYNEIAKVYPRGGGIENKLDLLTGIFSKLPGIHIIVLHYFISYLAELVSSVPEEEREIYLYKISLTSAIVLVRPSAFTSLNLNDRFPPQLLVDLVSNVGVLEKVMKQKKGRDERYKPRRQRTRPTDTRRFRTPSTTGSEPKAEESESKVEESKTEESKERITTPESPTSTSTDSTATLLSANVSPEVTASATLSIEEIDTSPSAKPSLSRSKRASLRGPRAVGSKRAEEATRTGEKDGKEVIENGSSDEFKECE